jgi:hypothetical protein
MRTLNSNFSRVAPQNVTIKCLRQKFGYNNKTGEGKIHRIVEGLRNCIYSYKNINNVCFLFVRPRVNCNNMTERIFFLWNEWKLNLDLTCQSIISQLGSQTKHQLLNNHDAKRETYQLVPNYRETLSL